MSDWRALGVLAEFEFDTCCGVEVEVSDTERLALVVIRHGDSHQVFLDQCPHRGAAFSTVGSVDTDQGLLLCGWHFWAFRLQDGGHTHLDSLAVPSYPTRLVDGVLEVDVAPKEAADRGVPCAE